jgi:hypothetical protein
MSSWIGVLKSANPHYPTGSPAFNNLKVEDLYHGTKRSDTVPCLQKFHALRMPEDFRYPIA